MAPYTSPSPGSAAAHFDKASASYERITGGCTRQVAQYLLTLSPPITSSSIILDNACGTGIVTEEIFTRIPGPKPKVYCADLAPSMIDILRSKATRRGWREGSDGILEASVINAEELDYPNNLFSHSYTNLGIFFYENPEKAAGHIYRTLQPGGTAFVTTWSKLGYMDAIHKAQHAVRPNDKLWEPPMDKSWLTQEKLRSVLEAGGFEAGKIQIQSHKVEYRGDDLDDLVNIMVTAFSGPVTNGWTAEERGRFHTVLRDCLSEEEGAAASIEMITLVAVSSK